jgi:glycine betaine/choline ABC-type transport system substrate-binding protein
VAGKKNIARVILTAVAVSLWLGWATGCDRNRSIVVGSKNFTEQVILGEILAQHLENRLHIQVVRKLNLGGTLLAHQALVAGEIDLYPEYTGTALTSVLKLSPSSNAETVLQTVRAEYLTRFRVQWLDPLGFNNTFAMVVRGEDAKAAGLTTLTDAKTYRPGWRLGVGYEFQQRPDGLPGLLKTYALPVTKVQTMDLGLLYQALNQKHVNMVAGNATDGQLSVRDVRVLQDDQHYFPPYQAAIVVRAAAVAERPELAGVLSELSGKFSDAQMQQLNYQVDGRHRAVAQVATEFLRQGGLLR